MAIRLLCDRHEPLAAAVGRMRTEEDATQGGDDSSAVDSGSDTDGNIPAVKRKRTRVHFTLRELQALYHLPLKTASLCALTDLGDDLTGVCDLDRLRGGSGSVRPRSSACVAGTASGGGRSASSRPSRGGSRTCTRLSRQSPMQTLSANWMQPSSKAESFAARFQ